MRCPEHLQLPHPGQHGSSGQQGSSLQSRQPQSTVPQEEVSPLDEEYVDAHSPWVQHTYAVWTPLSM